MGAFSLTLPLNRVCGPPTWRSPRFKMVIRPKRRLRPPTIMGAGWNGPIKLMTLPYNLPWWGWALAIVGSLWIGVSKTGIVGLGVLAVALFTFVFDAKASTGIVLPILIVADSC